MGQVNNSHSRYPVRTLTGSIGQQIELFDPPKLSLWGDASPGDLDPETASIVVGTKYRFSSLGPNVQITVWGIRWYRTDGFTGVSDVALWDGTTNLASATVTGETTEGWQQQLFEFPVFIDEDVIFTASALYTAGSFCSTPGLLASPFFFDGVDLSGNAYQLECVANSVSANGVYDFSSTMVCPTTSAAETCFYIDIIYSV